MMSDLQGIRVESSWNVGLIDLSKVTDGAKDEEESLTQEQLIPKLMFEDKQYKIRKDNAPKHCPYGLEALHHARSSLIVNRRPENAIKMPPNERLLAFAQYDIVDDEGHQLYVAVEKTSKYALRRMRDARIFEVTLYDHDCRKILTIQRDCSFGFYFAQYCCLLGTFGFKGCGNSATVTLCDTTNRLLGKIVQEFSCQQMLLAIHNQSGVKIMTISGKLVDGLFDVCFPNDEEDPIALIETSMTAEEVAAFYNLYVSNYEDPYGLTFLYLHLSPQYKALIICAIILMDFIFCKPSTDYPHWTQFIPSDFKPEDQTVDKFYTDGSKEVVITSVKPRNTRINIMRDQTKCGCCRWLCGFLCLCCPLGFSRNGIRCCHIICFGIFLIVTASLCVIMALFFTGKI